jgi:PAS domain S-box-containing protein
MPFKEDRVTPLSTRLQKAAERMAADSFGENVAELAEIAGDDRRSCWSAQTAGCSSRAVRHESYSGSTARTSAGRCGISRSPIALSSFTRRSRRCSPRRSRVEIRDVAWRTRDGKPLALNVRLTRLGAADGDGAVAVAFADMSETNQLQQDLETSNQELETAMEELQSTNEELQTVNQELHERTAELGDTNSFMSSILGSVRVGVVVLDENLRVQVWSPRAQDLWGLRADEVVVQSLMSLEIGLPLDPVRELIRRTLPREHGHEVIEVDAANRRGRGIQVRITCSRLQPEGGNGVILLMEDLSAGS